MATTIKNCFAFIVFTILSFSALAQKKDLTDEQYFKNNFKGIIQPLPTVGAWIDNSHVIISKEGKSHVLDCATGIETDYTPATAPAINAKPIVMVKNNDLYVNDVQLTNDAAKEINPTLSPDANYVAYTKNNNLYTVNINTKKETQITTDGNDVILNGYASWVYTEEILGRQSAYRSFWWSPDSKHIAFFRTDDSPVPVYTITDGVGQHGLVEKERYPKVGDPNPEIKVGIVNADGSAMVWADFNVKDDQYFGMPYWTNDGSSLWVQWMNRNQNNLKIYAVNPSTGSKKEIYDETQKTWIQLEDGYERLHLLANNKNFILESDKSGWNNLYLYDISGKLINAITSGKFTVTNLTYVDEKNSMIYFTARGKENTARIDFYKVNFNGKNLQRLSFGNFTHQINVSPNADYFITNYSNAALPNQLALVNNKGKIIKELGTSKAQDFDNYNLAKSDFLRVKSDDSLYDLPMKVIWPMPFDKTKKYPVLISIYGGPNAGTCWDSWNLNGTQQWYAKEGLIQVVMDHRASGHFGKEGVNYMYHNLGDWELKDYATMVKWLVTNSNANPEKICITGFSYGGYMTCLALTKYSDVFTYGMAGGSVTDWQLYDTHYTERYMGTPANNPEGYQTSAVLNYTDKYKGGLQIVHGIIDDNVHMQNSIQLISKLQDAKKDFEFMMYSGGRHGWRNMPEKWAHFQNLQTKFIYKNLLQKEVPKALLK